jgi:hypothetical protein
MEKQEIHNKELPGCKKCNRECHFNGPVASSSGPLFKEGMIDFYGCNNYMRRTGKRFYFVEKKK